MPFSSDKQKKWMFANKPSMAKKWANEEESGLYAKRKKKKKNSLTDME